MIAVKTRPSLEGIKRYRAAAASPARAAVSFCIILLIMLITLILSIVSYSKGSGSVMFIVLGAVIFAVTAICFVRVLRCPNAQFRALQKNAQDMVQSFTFDDDSFTVQKECTGIKEHSKQSYAVIKKALYKECWFVLVFGSGAGTVFHENSFTQGTPQELSALLREKLGRKYKVK